MPSHPTPQNKYRWHRKAPEESEGSIYEEDTHEELSEDSRSGRRESKKQRAIKTSKRHQSKVQSSDSNNDDAPPRRKRPTPKLSAKKKKKQQCLDSSSDSESEDDAPPPKTKRKKGSKQKSRECTARANINAFVRTAVHDIHPHAKPPGRFMYWDPKVPT